MTSGSRREEAEQALRHAWFPVARCGDLDRPQAATLLGENLVVYRTAAGKAVVQARRCPHRGADLSDGKVIGDAIACPYHGWQFDASDGGCTLIPSLESQEKIPPRAMLKTFPAVERFEHVWTVIDEPAYPMYDPPSWQGLELESAAANPIVSSTGVAAAMENFRDVAHFPFVHAVSMGKLPESVEQLKVLRDGVNVAMDRPLVSADGDWMVNGDCMMQYRCVAPGFASVIYDYQRLGRRLLGVFPSPQSYESVVLFCVVAIEKGFRGSHLDECVRFEEMVTYEDVAVVGKLDPPEVPWDAEYLEVSVPADAFTLNYRAAFWTFVREARDLHSIGEELNDG
ncbi:Rieske 2Fe-2S domain-containing protein [Kribbella ginsengisoli]|uniref:Aromatic ring-hydroxylating dioxygenase subunit alpha n=1 Tax=Kribbella ginsengisoli TaxID=363865 RepID=A0ABP6YC16_9ACTN